MKSINLSSVPIAMWWILGIACAALIAIVIFLELTRSSNTKSERVIRGARIVAARKLNYRTRVPKWSRGRRDERDQQLFIGGVAIPTEHENENFLLSGRPKMGKSQTVKGLGITIRKRGQRAIVADPDSAFLMSLAQKGDTLLNPFDARSAAWSPFAEIESDAHHALLATAIIPDSDGGDSEWRMYARQLYAGVSRRLVLKDKNKQEGEASIATTERLIYYLTLAGPKELGELIEGDISGQIAAKGNEKMFSNTRAVLSMFLADWQYLPPDGTFSVRKWVRKSGSDWLFLPYKDDQWAALKPLVSCWTSLAISEGLTLPPDPNRRLWYLLDELASLGRLPNLEDGVNKLRKHGGCVVACVQSIAQVRERYGANTAQSIFSSFGTWLILGAGDAETADAMSRHLGEQEVERDTHSHTMGDRSSSTEGVQRDNRALVMPVEIQNLPPREGYLTIAGNYPTAYVSIPIINIPDIQNAFIPRKES
jgi:type IV secretory pathway TraG/TraD family ATPase VirD4